MDSEEERQKKLTTKINYMANIIANNSRQSGASHIISTKYIYDILFPDKRKKRIEKIESILKREN